MDAAIVRMWRKRGILPAAWTGPLTRPRPDVPIAL